jgi:hypothetical protein
MLLVWGGMPVTFPEDSGIVTISAFLLCIFTAHLGASVSPSNYAKNWKTVLIALGAIVVASLLTVGVGGLIFGFGPILTGVGAAVGGGAISGILAIQQITDGGLSASSVVLPVLMIVAVDPLGQPICSFFMRKFIKKSISSDAYLNDTSIAHKVEEAPRLTKDGVPYGSDDNPSTFVRNFIPKKFETEAVILAEVSVIAVISTWLEGVTGVTSILFAIILGVLGCTFGFLRIAPLDRALSSGMAITFIIIYILTGMNEVTPGLLLSGLGPMLGIMVLASIGLAVGGGLMGKLLKYDVTLSIACSVAILFIMPGAAIVPDMLIKRLSRNEEEERYLGEKIRPMMYIMINFALVFTLAITLLIFLPSGLRML